MNTDLSVAPEIALLAAPLVPAQTDAPKPRTDGRLAGEAVETTGPSGAGTARPLRPGRVLVHGTRAPHRLLTAGHGYSVTLHAAVAAVR